MADVLYTRVSSAGQNSSRQQAGEGEHFEEVFEDQCSGGSTDRPKLKEMLRFVRKGDTVHVHSIDRLARSLKDLLDLIEVLTERGVTVSFRKEGLKFTGEKDPFQKLQLQMLGAVAEFERALIRERQREGIDKAKSAGKYRGRKPSVSREAVAALLRQGVGPSEITRRLGVGRTTVHRVQKELAPE